MGNIVVNYVRVASALVLLFLLILLMISFFGDVFYVLSNCLPLLISSVISKSILRPNYRVLLYIVSRNSIFGSSLYSFMIREFLDTVLLMVAF